MDRKPFTALLLVATIVLGAGAAWYQLSRSPRINLDPYQALGEIAGEEVSNFLHHQGGIVLVRDDPDGGKDPVLEAQLTAFRSSLKRKGKVSIAAVENVKLDPFTRMGTGGAVPGNVLMAIRARHADAQALVFFMAFPSLPNEEIAILRASKTRTVVISALAPGYREMLRSHAIDLAILPRPSTAENPGAKPPGSTRERFDEEYRIITPDTADQLTF